VLNKISVYLFIYVREHILKTTRPNFTKFTVHAVCRRGSVLFWPCCNTLCSLLSNLWIFAQWLITVDDRLVRAQSDSRGGVLGAKYDIYDCLLLVKNKLFFCCCY